MWAYSQITGQLWDAAGHLVGTGYSGYGTGKNNCYAQEQKWNGEIAGPIPQGLWHIGNLAQSEKTGRDILHLIPDEATDTYGRDEFEMHGDSAEHPGMASHGCIVMPHDVRLRVAESDDKKLYVQA